MEIHRSSVQEALDTLQSGLSGLAEDEAARRLMEYGRNEVEEAAKGSLLVQCAREFTHFFAIVLWIAAGLAFFAESRDPDEGMATLGGAIVGVILINGAFSFWQTYRAERALRALRSLLPNIAKTVRDGRAREIPAEELVPGDIILLSAGDRVPADCRVIEAFCLRVDNSTVTGESVPHTRESDPCRNKDLMEASNVLLAGTSIASGEARALVFATGRRTAFGEIAYLTQTVGETLSPLQKEISYMSRIVAMLALLLGGMFFFVGQALGLSFWTNFIFAIGIIVANVPEGLLPTVTLALALGSQRMARCHALVRHLPAVEALGCATVICTDKTGTLTENRMTAKVLFIEGRKAPAIGREAEELAKKHPRLFEIAACCHELEETQTGWLGDPMEVALVRLSGNLRPGWRPHPRVNVVPFDSQRRRLSTVHVVGDEFILFCKGAPEIVLTRCSAVEGGELLTPELRRVHEMAAEEMAQAGLRVLALASKRVEEGCEPAKEERGMTLAGLVGLEDPPRAEVPEAIRLCREAGIRVIMITGDHPLTAIAVAREIGLVHSGQPVVLTWETIQLLSDTQLQLALDQPEILFARVAAEQKMRIVSALARKREIVAVTGDGVNDAPALRRADIGIAMGRSGTDVAREASDVVLLDDNFASIVAAVREGRAVFANIRKFLTYILTSNVPEIVPYLAFFFFRIPLPLTVIQILAVDLGTDMLPALALGAEKPEAGVMKDRPRLRRERLINFPLLIRAYLILGSIQAVAAIATFLFVLRGGGWRYGEILDSNDPLYLQATTACLTAIIVMQVVNVFLCRSDQRPAFTRGFFANRFIFAGVAMELVIILGIVYTSAGNAVFGTHPVPLSVWLFAMPFAIGMAVIEEFRKWGVRRFRKRLDGVPPKQLTPNATAHRCPPQKDRS